MHEAVPITIYLMAAFFTAVMVNERYGSFVFAAFAGLIWPVTLLAFLVVGLIYGLLGAVAVILEWLAKRLGADQ